MKKKTILLLFPCLLALSSCSFTNSTTKVDDKELAKFDELRQEVEMIIGRYKIES